MRSGFTFAQRRFLAVVRLIERIGIETQAFHQEADEDVSHLLGSDNPADYRRYLIRSYGFVLPVEHAIAATNDFHRSLQSSRFRKHQLLRRDLEGFHMRPHELERLPLCHVPSFGSPEEAFGWAYVIERETHSHASLYRHLAGVMPGVVAFSSAYIKCYFGVVGEAWTLFGDLLEPVAQAPEAAERVIEAARSAFRAQRLWWRDHQDERAQLRA